MKRIPPLAVVAVLVAGALLWSVFGRGGGHAELTLHGNVDLREIALAFNNSERIASIAVQEGDRVHKGEVLARLDTSRLAPLVAAAVGALEVDNVSLGNTRRQFQRLQNLSAESQGTAVSRQALDDARAGAASAAAHADIDRAQVALLRQELADAALVAPSDAVVHARLLEPGEMSSPQKPVLSLAITDPKWVRADVTEKEVGKILPRMAGFVTTDMFPGRRFAGRVGLVSPAEFASRTGQAPGRRDRLAYEMRFLVQDPDDVLRLGMSATVHLTLDPQQAHADK